MKCLLAFAVAALVLPLAAQTGTPPSPVASTRTAPPIGFKESILLWPNGAPLALRSGTAVQEGDLPRIFTYPAPGAGPHPAVIVMPGGGYTHLVMDKEGSVEARWLNDRGVSAFVLEYRLSPAYRFPAPMLDGSRAVRYVRAHAAELAIDPNKLGVWGFSAGGHLSAYLATAHTPGDPNSTDPVERVPDRPDFAIISYGRMDLSSTLPRPAPTEASPGLEIVLAATTAQIDIVHKVTNDTSPAFIYSTTGDQTVDSRNASDFYNALKAVHVPAELHIFEVGPHGTGLAQNLPASERELTLYPALLANWMQLHGWMPGQP